MIVFVFFMNWLKANAFTFGSLEPGMSVWEYESKFCKFEILICFFYGKGIPAIVLLPYQVSGVLELLLGSTTL